MRSVGHAVGTISGLTWEDPYLLSDERLLVGSPFGKIVTGRDGTLLLPIYHKPVPRVSRPDELLPGDRAAIRSAPGTMDGPGRILR